jgi:hypothetical protein
MACDSRGSAGVGKNELPNAVRNMWPTPIRRDCRTFKGGARMKNSSGTEPLVVVVGGMQTQPTALNPEWVEWLMGWPEGWTDLRPLATDKFQQWLRAHGAPSHDTKETA